MNSTDTQQQVGEVQGGARAQFEAWAKSAGLETKIYDHNDMYSHPVTRGAWMAWQQLAARQPDTDEQYADEQALIDHLDELMDDGGQGGEKWPPAQAAIAGIIAARQPVGEPALYIRPGLLDACRIIDPAVPYHRVTVALTERDGHTVPLYAAPTSQAVDVGAVRDAVHGITLGFNGDLPYIKGIAEALALIDSKAVGK